MTWANHIQVAMRDAGTSAFLYWIGAENSTTNSALINLINNEVVPSKRFWAFAQFSRFVRPGAYRIEAASSNPNITVSSFKNENGRIATQLLNQGDLESQVNVHIAGLNGGMSVQPYITNNDYDLTHLAPIVSVKGGSFNAQIPARSLVTFVAL